MNSSKILSIILFICLSIIFFIIIPYCVEMQNNDMRTMASFSMFTEETVEPTLLPTPDPTTPLKVKPILMQIPAPTTEPTLEPTTEPEPVIETPSTEAIMIAKVIFGEARGVKSVTEQACIAWTILNRVDSDIFQDTIAEVILAPHQFCYTDRFPTVDDFGRDLVALAEDVLARWRREKAGETDVGRVLPPEYFYYGAINNRNWFRTDYYDLSTKWYYEWDSPYES